MKNILLFLKIQVFVLLTLVLTIHLSAQVWTPVGPFGGTMFKCLHLDTDNQVLLVGAEEGFWYWNIETNIWTPRIETGSIGRSVRSISSNPNIPGRIITGRVNAWFKGYMEFSDDWGESNNATFSSDGGYISDIKYSASNPNVFYACGVSDITPGDLLKSIDGGQAWIQQTNYLHTFMTSIAISPTNANTLYISGDALVTKSINGGLSWSAASNGLPSNLGVYCLDMNKSDENSLICSNDNGLYRTVDGGENWTQIYPESCKRIVYNSVYPNTIAVITISPYQILLSTDNGTDWVDITGNFPTNDYVKDLVFSEDGASLFVASTNNIYSGDIIISGIGSEKPVAFSNSFVLTNKPNPFSNSTTINYLLAEEQKVKIAITDISGRTIYTYQSSKNQIGKNTFLWDGKNNEGVEVIQGVYFFHLYLYNKQNLVTKMIKY